MMNKKTKQLIMRVGIIAILALSLLISNTVMADNVIKDGGPYQTRITIESIVPSPSVIEEAFIVSIKVEALDPLGGIPNGAVEIKSGEMEVCEITLNAAGEGACSMVFDTPQTVPLQAFYIGTDVYLPAASTVTQHEVMNKYIPSVVIQTDTPDPSIVMRSVSVAVAISSAWQDKPTGNVEIYRSSFGQCTSTDLASAVDKCSFTLDANGEGDCLIPITVSGQVQLCAAYPGDTAHFSGQSAPEPHTVSTSNSFVDLTTISPSPSVLGNSVNFNFSVTSPDGMPQNGLVSILSNSTLFCTAQASIGTCSASINTANEHVFYAAYAGETIGQVILQPSVSDPVAHYVQAPPISLVLSNYTFDMYRSHKHTVAKLSSSDPNPDDTLSYYLAAGDGDDDNAYFAINGDKLIALGNLSDNKDRISIRLGVMDQTGLSYERVFSISVNKNLPDLPDTGYQAYSGAMPTAKIQHKNNSFVSIEIPVLGVNAPIVGVPINNDQWNTEWLGAQVGWLHGSAFPGWLGNSYLAAHNYLPSGLPGPFEQIEKLSWGDEIILHAYGAKSVYAVRSVEWVSPTNKQVLTHEDAAWLTLVTCDNFDEATDAYQYRVIVRAVLVDVQ